MIDTWLSLMYTQTNFFCPTIVCSFGEGGIWKLFSAAEQHSFGHRILGRHLGLVMNIDVGFVRVEKLPILLLALLGSISFT